MRVTDGPDKPTLEQLVGRCVVLDTQGPVVYIGRLEAQDDRGYWLAQADLYDRNEGHSTKDRYVNDAHLLERSGARPVNRRRVFVERSAIISISALDDVVAEGPQEDPSGWLK